MGDERRNPRQFPAGLIACSKDNLSIPDDYRKAFPKFLKASLWQRRSLKRFQSFGSLCLGRILHRTTKQHQFYCDSGTLQTSFYQRCARGVARLMQGSLFSATTLT